MQRGAFAGLRLQLGLARGGAEERPLGGRGRAAGDQRAMPGDGHNAQVGGANITTRGLGKSKPIAHNTKPDGSDDPEGRAKNRRVQIIVRK